MAAVLHKNIRLINSHVTRHFVPIAAIAMVAFGLALAPVVPAAALAQDHAPASIDTLNPVATGAPKTVDANPALWVVKDADTTIYLFVTIHVLKPELNWFNGGLKAAFDNSQQLVLDYDDKNEQKEQELFGKFAIDAAGKTLRSKLTDAERASFDTAMTKLGIPVTGFDPLEPWAAGLTMQLIALAKAGYSPDSGAESVLTSSAKLAKTPIIGLETIEYQLGLLDSLPEPVQIRFLLSGAADIDAGGKVFDDLVNSWAAGDADTLAKLMNEGLNGEAELADRLLTQRNANWARWINRRMEKPGTIFIAVGAGHLSGTASVQHMLTAYGQNAQRVEY